LLGHPPREVWDYTPRQTAAFMQLAADDRQRELRELLAIFAMAARGDPKAIQKALKDDP
jgi:hypothetical protein